MERWPTEAEVNAALTRHRARRQAAVSAAVTPQGSFGNLPRPWLRQQLRAWFDEREAYLYNFIRDRRLSGSAGAGPVPDQRLGATQAELPRQRQVGDVETPQAVASEVAR